MVEGYRITIVSRGLIESRYEAVVILLTIGSELLTKGFYTNYFKGDRFLLILIRVVQNT